MRDTCQSTIALFASHLLGEEMTRELKTRADLPVQPARLRDKPWKFVALQASSEQVLVGVDWRNHADIYTWLAAEMERIVQCTNDDPLIVDAGFIFPARSQQWWQRLLRRPSQPTELFCKDHRPRDPALRQKICTELTALFDGKITT